MQQSVDITFYHTGSARCWAQITAACSPLRIENLHDRPVVAATPVSEADLRVKMDVFRPYHHFKVNFGLLSYSPMFVAPPRLHDSRDRLSSSKWYLRTSSMLTAVYDAWVRYRGFSHEVDGDGTVHSRSKVYVALWEKSHWIVESSVLMGMHPDFDSTRSTADVSTLLAL